MQKSLRATTALLAAGGLLLTATACASSDSKDSDAEPGAQKKISIVASTSIWADVAQAVADTASGVDIEVKPIVEGNGVDPHHFEPSAADIARAEDADVLVVNGGGYDSWIYQAVSEQDNIISALPLTDHGKLADDPNVMTIDAAKATAKKDPEKVTNIEGNEHIWYDPAALDEVAGTIADQINELNTDAHASTERVDSHVDRLRNKLKELPDNLSYAQTEPIADYIMKYASGKDVTPEGYRKATISEGEPTAADLAAFTKAIKEDKVDLLIFNPQTETDTAGRIKSAAEDADVTIVEIGETPPDGKEFWTYYDEVTDSLGQL
ncbi:zinc ABC transporter substrate-binding protein [Corynebacterium sp. c8Ua_181]|uniref:Zinc ABC transporter substrate-binding protein n=1 Tax=Corynebacterium curieae TaxID=2913500 RepID=A0A9X3RU32_9CORY|nr:zinc ABC transporter substrate-binding protein [Corynebacterium curieae]MCZ9307732.1 zinc ABC transporter substrate-binding protein [Corynebacterium curieae]MDV2424520.1 zinc ABC transporter substrate-binding protein [Corynebacterium curieae]